MKIDMDSSRLHHHHHQEMSSQTLESMLVCTKAQQEKKPRPPEQALKCPRCDSTNTKFCYYNNYSPTQPRYFCKSCRRYWTKGGTLRKVPVGGGCRKNKRSSSSSKRTQDLHRPLITSNPNNPNIDPLISSLVHLPYDSTTDLSLAFARLQSEANGHLGFDHNDHFLGNPQRISHSGHGFLGLLEGTPNPNNGFHENHVFYGGNIGNGEMGSVENGGNGIIMGIDDQEEMGMNINPFHDHQEHTTTGAETTAVSVTTVKQESCNGRSDNQCGENNRVLWGFPWQIGGENGNNMVEVDSGRVQNGNGWNGLGSTWHGLLNSPLM